MPRVTGLGRLTFAVPNIHETGAFYRDIWGMEALSHDANRWLLRCRRSDHCDLALIRGDGPAEMRELTMQVQTPDDLAALLAGVESAGGRIVTAAAADETGEWSATVADPDGRRIGLVVCSDGAAPRSLDSGTFGPQRIGHVVFWSPRIEAAEAFYAALGLRVTDRTTMGMSFLRCNADHHSLALVRSRGQTGVQHVAFDVGTFDAVMRECGRLKAVGVECVWGPGRHGPGDNVFAYYRDPAGIIIEFYGEMQKFSPDEEATEPVWWGPEHRGDIWGLAGPAPDVFRP